MALFGHHEPAPAPAVSFDDVEDVKRDLDLLSALTRHKSGAPLSQADYYTVAMLLQARATLVLAEKVKQLHEILDERMGGS